MLLSSAVSIIVIDARRTKVAELATIHLQPKQGTDAALGAGICRVLFEEGLYNKPFCDKWVYGVEEYRNYCKDFPPEKTEALTGVPADLIVKDVYKRQAYAGQYRPRKAYR